MQHTLALSSQSGCNSGFKNYISRKKIGSYSANFLKIELATCPPNPNVLFSA